MIINTNDPIIIEDYVQTRTPDKTELARLLVESKGPDRNMAEFAKLCGSSPSTFSRIANCKITQPLDTGLLVRIAEQYGKDSEAEKNLMLHSLLEANGMMPKDFLERKRSIPFLGLRVEEDEKLFSRERDIKNVITMNLLDRGVGIRYIAFIKPDTGIHSIARRHERSAFSIQIDGEDPEYYRFNVECLRDDIRVLKAGNEDKVDPVTGRDYQCEADNLFRTEAQYFLIDAWEPYSFKNLKNSYVFDDKGYFESFYRLLENRRVNSWISLILVDVEKQSVIEERFIQRIDGKTMKSLYDLPVLQSQLINEGDV